MSTSEPKQTGSSDNAQYEKILCVGLIVTIFSRTSVLPKTLKQFISVLESSPDVESDLTSQTITFIKP